MADIKFKFKRNLAGLNELMKSAEMQGVLNSAAAQIASYANASHEGYEIESAHPIGFVAIASVSATDFESRLDNSENNTLLKACGSVKL